MSTAFKPLTFERDKYLDSRFKLLTVLIKKNMKLVFRMYKEYYNNRAYKTIDTNN